MLHILQTALELGFLYALVPMALLTSMSADNPALQEIPEGVAVIRVGEHFTDDFAAAIAHFNLG